MAFDSRAFMKAEFQPRTAEITLASLQSYFGDDVPVWKVRGQSASEVARAMEAGAKTKNIEAIIKAIGSSQAQIDELKAAIGIGSDVPGDIVKRLEMLHVCSVSPEIDMSVAIKLAENFPIEFYMLTNKITELTGLGADVKKPQGSGKIKASKVA